MSTAQIGIGSRTPSLWRPLDCLPRSVELRDRGLTLVKLPADDHQLALTAPLSLIEALQTDADAELQVK